MRRLIRRLTRVADSSQLEPIYRERGATGRGRRQRRVTCPEGHVPVRVGDEMEQFAVPAELLSRAAFAELLNRSAQEYGYEQKGVLRIPCPVNLFRRILDAEAGDLDLVA